MNQETSLEWLATNDQYARTIVRLAGVKVAPVEGLRVGIAAYWTGQSYEPPITMTAYSMTDEARLVWTPEEDRPLLFKLTLEKLTKSFQQMMLPERTVICHVVINPQTKKPHFQRFFFVHGKLNPKMRAQIWLRRKDWDSEELENIVKEIRKAPTQLKGMGLTDD